MYLFKIYIQRCTWYSLRWQSLTVTCIVMVLMYDKHEILLKLTLNINKFHHNGKQIYCIPLLPMSSNLPGFYKSVAPRYHHDHIWHKSTLLMSSCWWWLLLYRTSTADNLMFHQHCKYFTNIYIHNFITWWK
jgi:hypothetical protein